MVRWIALMLVLVLAMSSGARADSTRVDLYRLGNSSSPRMDNVREKDVEMFERDGKTWVKARSGGVSTFSKPSGKSNEWRLKKGTSFPSKLRVYNDHGDHWQWEPEVDMPLDDYLDLLRQVNRLFEKMS